MPKLTYIPDRAAKDYKLLLIGDGEIEQVARRAMAETDLKASIYTSGSLQESLQVLQQQHFDCIVLNCTLSDPDSYQLLQSIHLQSNATPVLAITVTENGPETEQALQGGATECLPLHMLTPENFYHGIRVAIRLKKAELNSLCAAEKLNTCQSQLDFLVSNTPTAFWNTDAEGNFVYAHGPGFELLGVTPSDLIGKNFYVTLNQYPRIIERFERALSGEVVQSVDETNNTYFKAHYMPIYDENGKVAGVTGFAIDITERIWNERELLKIKEVAEKSARIKEQFLANISHEIRTPMNGIIGLTNVLRRTRLDQEQTKCLDAIRKSADNLMQIINDMLDFSKISANQFTFEEIEFNLAELVQDILDLMDNKARERNNMLVTFMAPDVPMVVNGDPLRLRQVILNLVSNAIKFTENGQIKLKVNRLEETDDTILLEFTVEDSGIGIPGEKLHTIFESFNQGSNDITRRYGGTGLGLTISKNIVEMQGGTLTVRSQPQAGSAFTFSIPFRKVTTPHHQVPETPQPKEEYVPNKLSGSRVLVAESDKINQLLITNLLNDWGIKTDVVGTGLDALEKVFENTYDLLILDMHLPVMDGYEVLAKIRSGNTVSAKMPIVAFTTNTLHHSAEKCLEHGANTCLLKPFDTNELLETVVHLLRPGGTSDRASVNMKALIGMAGDNPSFLLEVLSMYIESTPLAVKKLLDLIEEGQLDEARIHLAGLYDSVSVLSAKPLQFTFEQMASALVVGDIPLLKRIAMQAITECDDLIELLQQEYNRLE